MNKQIAITILKQIGGKVLFMIGARKPKSMIALDNGVIFKVGKNSKRINKIKITLNSMDTYDVEYWHSVKSFKVYKQEFEDKSKLISSESGIYNDGLRDSIERNTGLYTSL